MVSKVTLHAYFKDGMLDEEENPGTSKDGESSKNNAESKKALPPKSVKKRQVRVKLNDQR